MSDQQEQLEYRADIAARLASGKFGSDDDRLRMSMIASGKPEELLERLRVEDPANVWSVEEFREQFEARGFCAPFVICRRKSTGEEGMLMFTHLPRWYFGWLAT